VYGLDGGVHASGRLFIWVNLAWSQPARSLGIAEDPDLAASADEAPFPFQG
jgi:hypothetical protein